MINCQKSPSSMPKRHVPNGNFLTINVEFCDEKYFTNGKKCIIIIQEINFNQKKFKFKLIQN